MTMHENAIAQIRQAIESIYNVSVPQDNKLVSIHNNYPNIFEKLSALRNVVASTVSNKAKKNETGKHLLSIWARGTNPYNGYMVTIIEDDNGNLAQRFTTPGEASMLGYDMY